MATKSKKHSALKPADLYALVYPTLKALQKKDVDYAVGGAVAMAAHGYVRDTTDLDIFFKDEDANTVLTAFRKKFKVATIQDPFMFCIFPDLREPDIRVDLLFTSIEMERDAVDFPDGAKIHKLPAHVFPRDVLVAVKLASSREKDHSDVARMFERGLFEPKKVEAVLRQNQEDEALERLRDLSKRRTARPKR